MRTMGRAHRTSFCRVPRIKNSRTPGPKPGIAVDPGRSDPCQSPESRLTPGRAILFPKPGIAADPGRSDPCQSPESRLTPGRAILCQSPESALTPEHAILCQSPESRLIPEHAILYRSPESRLIVPARPPSPGTQPGADASYHCRWSRHHPKENHYRSNRNHPKSNRLPGRNTNVTFRNPLTGSKSNIRSS